MFTVIIFYFLWLTIHRAVDNVDNPVNNFVARVSFLSFAQVLLLIYLL